MVEAQGLRKQNRFESRLFLVILGAMADQEFRIEKWSVPVAIRTARGERIEGEIFVDMLSTEGFTVKEVLDYFNSPVRFFPLKLRERSQTVLLAKDFLETVEISGGLERFQSETSPATVKQKEAMVHMDRIGPLRATIIMEMPEDHSRILDLLSLPNHFFASVIDHAFCLINASRIFKIEEL